MEFISLSPLPIISTIIKEESSQWLRKNIERSTDEEEFRERMDRCTGFHYITEISLKMVLNTMKSINQPINKSICYSISPRINESHLNRIHSFLTAVYYWLCGKAASGSKRILSIVLLKRIRGKHG